MVVELLTDKPDVVFASGSRVFAGDSEGNLSVPRDVRGEERPTTLTIERARPFKQGLIVQFQELADRDSAELWRGRYLLAPFSELPPPAENEVYLHDLVGMKVESRRGDPLGTVSTLYELPQGVMLDVTTGKGSVLIPYRPEIIVRTDIDARVLVLDESLGFQDPQ